MTLEFKKRKKGIFERIFTYPSFNLRFSISLLIVLFFSSAAVITVIIKTSAWQNRLTCFSLLLQGATLVFGVVATYFALQQLTESRQSKLEEVGGKDLRGERYFNAMSSWRDALYIKPTSSIFLNLMEVYIIAEELKDFDELAKYLKKRKSFQRKTITEPKDYIILCYLQIFRGLIVENMGVAKEHLIEMVSFIKKEEFKASLGWNFNDIKKSPPYLRLTGDHKITADNLILYLSKRMTLKDNAKFEAGDYLFPPTLLLLKSAPAVA